MISNALKSKEFIPLIYAWLIGCVSIAIIYPLAIPCNHFEALGPRQPIFRGPETLKQFMAWLFQSQSKEHKSHLLHEGATVVAHTFKGYDGQFILNFVVHQAFMKPTVIMNGSKRSKILSMEIAGIHFLDSYNNLLFALSKMISVFRFQEWKKGFFPHFFNTEGNQHFIGPFPSPAYYNPDDICTSDRQIFKTTCCMNNTETEWSTFRTNFRLTVYRTWTF